MRSGASRHAPDPLKTLRLEVQEGTLRVVKTKEYESEGRKVTLDKARMEKGRKGARVVRLSGGLKGHLKARKLPGHGSGPKIEVAEGDCLYAAQRLLHENEGEPVGVLNMANENHPGGGWKHGAGAQEENLHRRTDLCDHLSDHRDLKSWHEKVPYPLPHDGGVFSSDVCVFRGSEADGYPFLKEPYFVSVLTVAAVNKPAINHKTGDMESADEDRTAMRILLMLQMAKDNGVRHLVLSAFGCGAFRNPPRHVARLFKWALHLPEFREAFGTICFAIIEDHNSKSGPDGGNVKPFREILCGSDAADAPVDGHARARDRHHQDDEGASSWSPGKDAVEESRKIPLLHLASFVVTFFLMVRLLTSSPTFGIGMAGMLLYALWMTCPNIFNARHLSNSSGEVFALVFDAFRQILAKCQK